MQKYVCAWNMHRYVHMYMCAYMHAMHVCLCVAVCSVFVYAGQCVYARVWILCIRVCMPKSVYVYMYTCIYTCACICVYLNVCVIYTYTCVYRFVCTCGGGLCV